MSALRRDDRFAARMRSLSARVRVKPDVEAAAKARAVIAACDRELSRRTLIHLAFVRVDLSSDCLLGYADELASCAMCRFDLHASKGMVLS